jgi:DNA-binding Xre family transcriptional regulator
MSPERRARNEAEAERMLREMPLEERRTARAITQTHLAEVLGIKQAGVSKMERRTDMYIRTLSRFIEAMGGPTGDPRQLPGGLCAHHPIQSGEVNRALPNHRNPKFP